MGPITCNCAPNPDSTCHFTDDAKIKVPKFKNSHFFLQFEIFLRDAIHLYFCLFEDVSDC